MKNVEKLCLDCDNWIKELVQLKQVWYSVNCELSWYVYACENHSILLRLRKCQVSQAGGVNNNAG